MKRTLLAIGCSALLAAGCQKPAEQPMTLTYPQTKQVDTVDTYFGQTVADPYRWLEDDNAEDTKAWVDSQNSVTFGYLDQIGFRDKIRKRLTEIYNYPRFSSPFRVGEFYMFYKNDGLQNQSVLYIQKGLEGEPEVFLDPNKLSSDGTVTANLSGLSHDDRYITFNVARSGSDWQEIYVMDVASRQQLPDTIRWAKFTGTSWQGEGFYYSAYDPPKEGQALSGKNEYMKVYYHRLGTKQAEDVLVYEDRQHPLRYFGASVTEDESMLILSVSEGTSGNELHYRNLKKGDKTFKPLITGFKSDSYVVDNVGEKLLVYTNADAPNYRLVEIDPAKPDTANWKDIIPEKEMLLEGVSTAGGKLFATYLQDVKSVVYQMSMSGQMEREIQLPTLGSASGFGGKKEDTFVFYTFTSFTYPPTIFKYDLATGQSELFKKAEVKVNPDDYETKQVFYTSKDGTKVPMFIVHKKGLAPDGQRPTYLYGYGGFNISLTPSFSPSRFILLENGGVFVLANLRGGGEYGEAWHKAGMLEKKQNVFDDFIAAAEWLIANQYTSSGHLAIAGGSNGGLLVGAAMTQRPELFKVAFPAVGVLDMLRYHKFTVGWGWVVEYGSSEQSEESFRNLLAYSPLHNLKDGTAYPATMVTTADHDDRVVPAHSFKFIAELQRRHSGPNPVLIRIEKKAGHGAGKPISKIIDEQTDVWSFMFHNMGVTPYQEQ